MKLAVGTRKGLLIFDRSDGDWKFESEFHSGVRVSYAAVDSRDGTLYCCLDDGHFGCKFHRSDDLGGNWTEIPAPAYPAGAKLGNGQDAVLRYQWVLAPGAADQPGRIYIGTEPGGLFVSEDRGDSFTLNESLWNHPTRMEGWFGGGRDQPGIHSVFQDPRNSQHLYIGISCAGVFFSPDDGATWEIRNNGMRADFLPEDVEVGFDPHFMQCCKTHPDVLWQQNHCGIYRSEDSGRNWIEVSEEDGPANFGFVITVDDEDPNTAWVVPAESDQVRAACNRRMCVSRTEDGGKTWQDFRKGLPQENCYDFAFRHGMDICGDELVMATASGSLYWSDDCGESWQTIAKDLQPVYSVRFI